VLGITYRGEVSRTVSNVERNAPLEFWVLGVMLGVFCLWLLFSWTTPGHRAEALMFSILPGWFVVTNLLLAPCFMALAAGPWRIRLPLRLTFAALTLGSIVITEITFGRFLLASFASVGILVLEAYWIIPKWNDRQRRVP